MIKHRRRPNGSQVPSGRITVQSTSREFRWNSFLFFSRVRTVVPYHPDGRTSAATNFLIKASRIWTGGMVVRTVDLMHAISISNARASGPCWLVSGRLDFECDTCLMDKHFRTVAAIFPYLCFGKKSWILVEHWKSSERAAETSRRMQTRAIRNFSTQGKACAESSRSTSE